VQLLVSRGANVGAMLLRNALCRVNDQLGDGGATTAALAHALLAGGYRQLAAGANPMLLRRGMECGLRAAVAALQAQARPLGGERDLAGLAHAATGDAELSQRLGEIFAEWNLVSQQHVQEILRKQLQANRGDTVVAMINDEATVKRYYPEGDTIRFQPANSSMQPILVKKREFKSVNILGVVIGVYRKLQ